MENKDIKILKLASDVLMLSKNSLIVHLRFLDMAMSMLKNIPVKDIDTIGTDGKYIYYNPIYILKVFKFSKEMLSRSYIHMLMHCVFRHNIVSTLVDKVKWNLACDITVENIINDLNLNILSCPNETKQKEIILNLKSQIKYITAEKIYYWLLNQNFSDQKIQEWSVLFGLDYHDIWYQKSDNSNKGNSGSNNQQNKSNEQNNKSKNNQDENQNQNQNNNSNDNQEDNQEQDNNTSNENQNQNNNSNNNQEDNQERNNNGSNKNNELEQEQKNSNLSIMDFQNIQSQLEQEWKEVAEKMQVDLETFSNGRYGDAGNLMQNLKAVNREKQDFSQFLKKFAVMGEAMKINDDEFDYIFYTYGMNLFANEGRKMPLIEPLEYKDEKKIKEFVIAIDTSGSVIGDLVQKFVQKAYSVLKSTESYFTKVNIHIIQCDSEIQEDKKITSQEEFDDYIKTMTLHGFGGNNEIRLFNYIDELIMKKEFTNLKGMVYFTDGYGIFPKKKPDYDVAFVFLNERYEIPEVPPWVIRLVLQSDEI